MDLNYFKDQLFDLINESETLDILDIEADDKKNLLRVFIMDGSVFEIECIKIE